jgi:hypothetical protein
MMRPTARLIEEKKPSEATHQRSPAESRRRSPPKPVPVRSQLAGDRLSGSSVFGHRADVAKIAGCELSIKPQARGRSGREKSGRKSCSSPTCRTEVHSITVGSSSLFNRAPTGEAPITVIIAGSEEFLAQRDRARSDGLQSRHYTMRRTPLRVGMEARWRAGSRHRSPGHRRFLGCRRKRPRFLPMGVRPAPSSHAVNRASTSERGPRSGTR